MTVKEWEEYFKNYKKCDWTHIKDYVVEVKPEYEKTLRANVLAEKAFIEIRKEFYKKYFPEYIPVAKEGNTMLDWAAPDKAKEKKKEAAIKAKQKRKAKKEEAK